MKGIVKHAPHGVEENMSKLYETLEQTKLTACCKNPEDVHH
jgi:hypothetical protein